MSNRSLLKSILFSLFFLLSFSSVYSQTQQSGVLSDPGGARYQFHWVGDLLAANPRVPIPAQYETIGTQGWISYAITHQLSKAKTEGSEFFQLAQQITGKRSLGAVMGTIVNGCGYWLQCPAPNAGTKDLRYTGENVVYQIFINTDLNEIYVGEFLNSSLIEVHKCFVGRRWFEEDPEPYENPVISGNPGCEEPEPVVNVADPVAIIIADPESGSEPLNVFFDGRNSYDPDGGDIVKYIWDFGGSNAADGPTPSFQFERADTFHVLLTVVDDEGDRNTSSHSIFVHPYIDDSHPPVALILASPIADTVPFSLQLDGSTSYDPDGGSIVAYRWWREGSLFFQDSIPPQITIPEAGEYEVVLEVEDDEGQTNSVSQTISAFPPTSASPAPEPGPVPDPAPIPVETCWMMSYTLSMCGGTVDTLVQTPIRVPCPGPPEPQIVWTDRDCQMERISSAETKRRPLQLAGGPIFLRYRGQLPEYGLGVNAQIRYRLGRRQRLAVLLDATVLPSRKATPLDDRPYKWSTLRDSIDKATGLPLVWYRGTNRGTASLGVGIEIAPFPWLYVQGMGTVERTFHQAEISDPRKNPENRFVGFDLETFLYEGRIGIRKEHLEIYIGGRLSQENRPFTLIPPNELGGSHNPRWDKTYEAGISIFY
ncbi:MAG: PKD domain-containing protein [Bacteroidota bacterium]